MESGSHYLQGLVVDMFIAYGSESRCETTPVAVASDLKLCQIKILTFVCR
jgi:hypothetical protein